MSEGIKNKRALLGGVRTLEPDSKNLNIAKKLKISRSKRLNHSKRGSALLRIKNSASISHDDIVKKIAAVIDQTHHEVILNIGQGKKARIEDCTPDIILAAKGTSRVKFILEVEMDHDITENTAKNKWKKYADTINATPCIVVPKTHISQAERLCNRVGVSTRFATYDVDSLGTVLFNFK